MTEKDEPAFPVSPEGSRGKVSSVHGGLTKREYAAIRAMEGILAGLPQTAEYHAETTAETAVRHADALLAELAKEPKP